MPNVGIVAVDDIQTHEFDIVRQHVVHYRTLAKYHGHPFTPYGLTGPLLGFFDPTPIEGEYTTEDYAFCRRWRTLCGGDVWALPSEDIGHVGEYVYRGKPDVTG